MRISDGRPGPWGVQLAKSSEVLEMGQSTLQPCIAAGPREGSRNQGHVRIHGSEIASECH